MKLGDLVKLRFGVATTPDAVGIDVAAFHWKVVSRNENRPEDR